MNELATTERGLIGMSREQLGELVQSLPAEQRAAFSKAASAASRHLRDARKNYNQAFDLASAMVENWWRLGAEIPRLGIGRGKPGPNSLKLEDLGIDHNQSAFAQKLAQKSKDELDEWLEGLRDEERYRLPTLFGASQPHVTHNSGENEWYTPPEYIEAARAVMGSINLDPASSDKAQETVKAEKYYTIRDDGLSLPWEGNVWMNPPYSGDLVEQFIDKLCDEKPFQFVVLVNNATDTGWFHKLVVQSHRLCFTRKRISFLDSTGGPSKVPIQGQAFAYHGPNCDRFWRIFSSFGFICKLK